MKKLSILILLLSCLLANAQKAYENEKKHGFKKENMFTGGSVNVNFFNGQTLLGGSPVLGYSINRFVDAGIVTNFTYVGSRDYSGSKTRQFLYGPGIFTKIYPVKMIFAQGVFEHNFFTEKYIPAGGGSSSKYKTDANSLLVGGGYCNGREGVGSMFYYVSIMFDVSKLSNSPYVEQLQDFSYRSIPIIKAGLQIPLFNKGGNYDPDAR